MLALGALRARADVLVDVTFFSIFPDPVYISTGEAVFWTDADGGGPYGIYANNGSWQTQTDSYGIRFLQAGTYGYFDDNGNTGTIYVTANIPPSVTITNPANNAVLSAPASFSFAVSASDPDVDGLSDVEFYVGTNLVDDIFSEPFTTYVTGLPAGNYTLTAIAYDNAGATASSSISITVGTAPPPPTLIPAPNRADMVYDAGRDILYITSGTNVLRYQLASNTFLTPFPLSGSLMGIDLSPDGNTLMVADYSATSNVWVHVIDLASGQSHKVFFPAAFYESGTFAVAFGGDGAALITSRFAGSGWVPLRRYDPVSGLTTTIASVRHDSMVSSSGDGSTIVIAESDISNGPFSRYDVAQRAITRSSGDGWFNYECAASRDASLFALPTYGGTFIYDGNFNRVTNIGVYAGAQPIGAAFHPAADAVFFPFAGTTYVKAYSTTNWALLAQYDFQNTFSTPGNHAFTNGRIRISPDGQVIFVTVSGGVRYLRHNLNLPLAHRMLVAGSPAPYGAPTPMSYGTYWLPHGTNLTISVPADVETNGIAVIATGWTGTGSAAGSGTNTTTSFTLMANSTLTWNWTPFMVSANTVSLSGGKQTTLRWPSVAGKSYDVLFATNLLAGFAPVATNLSATPPSNTYQSAIASSRAGFYRVKMK